MIRLAKPTEIEEIISMTRACAEKMKAQGIYQWNEHYPSEAAFQNDLKRNELYVFISGEAITGCITISSEMDEEYFPISWLTPTSKQYYIHRLAVHPNHQNQGRAKELMDFAEAFAKKEEAISVRLDTFSQNQRNQRFYKARGYQQLGNIYFPKQSEHPFYCFELVL